MKRNILNKTLIVVFAIVIVISILTVMTACKETGINWTEVQSNMNNLKSMECKILMTDKTVTVVDYTKTVSIEGENANVSIKDTKLGDDFEYQTDETDNEIENVDKKTLLPLNIDSAVISTLAKSSSEGDNVYAAELEEVFVKQLMNINGDMDINGTATLKVKFNGNSVEEITLDYVTGTGRVVSAVYTYVY